MMSKIDFSLQDLPPYAIWTIGGWILSSLITTFTGYRWGLRSQKEARKHESKIAILSAINGIIAEAGTATPIPMKLIFDDSRSPLKSAVFAYTAHLGRIKSSLRIEAAWQAYDDIKSYSLSPEFNIINGADDLKRVRTIIVAPLEALRKEIG
jgi:hypothetical protein